MVLFRSKYYINGTVLIAVLILISGHSEVSFIFRVHSTKGSLQNNMNLYQADTLFQKKTCCQWLGKGNEEAMVYWNFLIFSIPFCALKCIQVNQGWHTLTTISGLTQQTVLLRNKPQMALFRAKAQTVLFRTTQFSKTFLFNWNILHSKRVLWVLDPTLGFKWELGRVLMRGQERKLQGELQRVSETFLNLPEQTIFFILRQIW